MLTKSEYDVHVEYYKEYGNNIGLLLHGKINTKEEVDINYISPYFLTDNKIYIESIDIEKYKKGYIAKCVEEETGKEIKFFVQNSLDYLSMSNNKTIKQINIVGLSKAGSIILPVKVDKENEIKKAEEKFFYNELVKKAKLGDYESNRKLTNIKIQTTKTIKSRLQVEDFLSVVESYLLAHVENETKSNLLGLIIDIKNITNERTNDKLFLFKLDINETILEVCINEKDLRGMPFVGMRFMGECWLQGKVLYG